MAGWIWDTIGKNTLSHVKRFVISVFLKDSCNTMLRAMTLESNCWLCHLLDIIVDKLFKLPGSCFSHL